MFKKRGLLLVMLSMIIAAAAAWTANSYLKTRIDSAAADADHVTVVAAAMRLPYGTKLETRHVKFLQVPDSIVPPGAIRDFKEIEGQIIKSEILDGEILLKDRVAGIGTGSSLAALVGPNKRAVSVRVNDVVGVGGFLLPGNYVDVLGTRREAGTSRRAVSETIIHNVKVLAVDQTAATEKNEPVVVRAVTLELSPKEAEVLVKWEEEGAIQLALRNPLDSSLTVEEKPAPAPKPVVQQVRRPVADNSSTVTLIRGTKVEQSRARR